MIVFDKTYPKCVACKYYGLCDNKRLAACAIAKMPDPLMADAIMPSTAQERR